MPPALSDDENGVSSSAEEIPFRGKGKEAKAAEVEEEEQEVEDDEDELDEEEYVVEKIMSHKIKTGTIEYHVKWEGYDKPKDYTWEPEENLESAIDILKEYWEEIGGRPEIGKKKRGRKSGVDSGSATPSSTKRAKKEKEWSPPLGSWENEVEYVETVEEVMNHKTGQMTRYAYLQWQNQKKSQHPLHHVYQKCPQKMLQYYESHLVFTQPAQENGGDDNMIEEEKDV